MISVHSLERAKERLGLNQRMAATFLQNAISRGKTASEFKKRSERLWLERHEQNGCSVRVYNGCCAIVSQAGVCVTIYELPAWFGKKQEFGQGKRKVRNRMRYLRMNCAVV